MFAAATTAAATLSSSSPASSAPAKAWLWSRLYDGSVGADQSILLHAVVVLMNFLLVPFYTCAVVKGVIVTTEASGVALLRRILLCCAVLFAFPLYVSTKHALSSHTK